MCWISDIKRERHGSEYETNVIMMSPWLTPSSMAASLTGLGGEMVLYVIGLGLGDEKDITVRGLEAVRRSTRVVLEHYTSILGVDKDKLVSGCLGTGVTDELSEPTHRSCKPRDCSSWSYAVQHSAVLCSISLNNTPTMDL